MRQMIPFAFLMALSCADASGQNGQLWGLTPSGGLNDKGTIFHLNADGSGFTTDFHFDGSSGWGPEGSLCLAPNGKLYGCTTLGGEASPGAGTLFSFDPAGGGFHKIQDFDGVNGGFNWGAMVVGDDGLLYGAGYGGGGLGGGAIYRVDPATDTYTELHGLSPSVDGSAVNSPLYLASDGLFYGAASMGGANNAGTLFSFDPVSNVFTKLHDFTGADGGSTPYSGLCEAGNGWLYGTTFDGGAANKGIVYKYDPTDHAFVKLFDIDALDCSNSWAQLVNAGPDLLYGTLTLGGLANGGVIFSIVPSTDAYTELFSFNLLNGGTLFGGPILGIDGSLFGLCASGGTNFTGTVYQYDPAADVMTNLHSFDPVPDGSGPRGDLVGTGMGVGIAEQPSPPAFALGPNPTSGEVTFWWNDGLPHDAVITITDAIGRVVRRTNTRASVSHAAIEGPPGVYLVTVTTATTRWEKRVVRY